MGAAAGYGDAPTLTATVAAAAMLVGVGVGGVVGYEYAKLAAYVVVFVPL